MGTYTHTCVHTHVRTYAHTHRLTDRRTDRQTDIERKTDRRTHIETQTHRHIFHLIVFFLGVVGSLLLLLSLIAVLTTRSYTVFTTFCQIAFSLQSLVGVWSSLLEKNDSRWLRKHNFGWFLQRSQGTNRFWFTRDASTLTLPGIHDQCAGAGRHEECLGTLRKGGWWRGCGDAQLGDGPALGERLAQCPHGAASGTCRKGEVELWNWNQRGGGNLAWHGVTCFNKCRPMIV